jgi:hypothetical protein
MPAGLEQLIIGDPDKPKQPPGSHMPSTAQLQGLINRVAVERTNRNNVLYWAANRLVEANYPEQAYDLIADAALTAGLPQSEVNKTINSARKAAA